MVLPVELGLIHTLLRKKPKPFTDETVLLPAMEEKRGFLGLLGLRNLDILFPCLISMVAILY